MQPAKIILKNGREKSVLQRHPWIFSGAIDEVLGSPGLGETVAVLSSAGQNLGHAAFSPKSNIRARMWTFDETEVTPELLRMRISDSINRRTKYLDHKANTAARLVFAESDGIPGLIVDQYNQVLVAQFLSAGAEYWRKSIITSLIDLLSPEGIVERSDVDVRSLEGLPEQAGLISGKVSEPLVIYENNLSFKVDVLHGQKTGFYLDQRLNRVAVGQSVAAMEVLNCFCFTGAFSVYALSGKAVQVVSVDSSQAALIDARENFHLNGLEPEQNEWVEGDVFQVLRKLRDQGRKFDAIILDPPKFAPTISQAERAARGYKDINLLAFKLLRTGGLLFTFSCSGGISTELFQKIVAGAALDAKVDAQILTHFSQGPDHPIGMSFPESSYLKGLAIRVG